MFVVRWEVQLMSEGNHSADRPAERRRQAVAAILARGALRHRHAANASACSVPRESASSPQNCLGTGDSSRPCVPVGSGGYGPGEPQERTPGVSMKSELLAIEGRTTGELPEPVRVSPPRTALDPL